MRIADFGITVVVVAGLSGPALAQSVSSATSSAVTSSASPATSSGPDHWFASAYLGSNFGSGNSNNLQNVTNINVDTGSNASINFGGEVGYTWAGKIGAEFLANYSPNFELTNVLLERRPNVATYMFNGIAAVPISTEHRFRPFVSGGIGEVALHSTTFTIVPPTGTNVATLATTTTNGTRFGWDLGGGVMVFNGAWGLRGDVRYYKATVDNNPTDHTIAGVFLTQELSGLSFWNANFGIAFRF
jgi:hypothetical protein